MRLLVVSKRKFPLAANYTHYVLLHGYCVALMVWEQGKWVRY